MVGRFAFAVHDKVINEIATKIKALRHALIARMQMIFITFFSSSTFG